MNPNDNFYSFHRNKNAPDLSLKNLKPLHGMSLDNGGGSSSCLVASTAASSFSPSYSTVHEL